MWEGLATPASLLASQPPGAAAVGSEGHAKRRNLRGGYDRTPARRRPSPRRGCQRLLFGVTGSCHVAQWTDMDGRGRLSTVVMLSSVRHPPSETHGAADSGPGPPASPWGPPLGGEGSILPPCLTWRCPPLRSPVSAVLTSQTLLYLPLELLTLTTQRPPRRVS